MGNNPGCPVVVTDLLMDTKGHCLLCYDNVEQEMSPAITSFQCLSRYLNLDLSILHKINNPRNHHHNQAVVEPLELRVPLCEECAPIINDTFAEVYRQLKKIEGEMASCLDCIREKLSKSSQSGTRKLSDNQDQTQSDPCQDEEDSAELKLVADVREQVMKKCSLKLNKLLKRNTFTSEYDGQNSDSNSEASSSDAFEVGDIFQNDALKTENLQLGDPDESQEDEHDEDDDMEDMSLGLEDMVETQIVEANDDDGDEDDVEDGASPTETTAPVVLGTFPYRHQQQNSAIAANIIPVSRRSQPSSSSSPVDPSKVAHYDAFTCGVCKKRFKTTGAKSNHQRSHFAPKFSCPHCPYKAQRNGLLVRHMVHKHRPPSNQNPN